MGRIQGTTVNVTAAQTTLSPALTGIVAGNTLILSVVDATQTSGYAASGVSGAGATWYRGVSTAGTVGIIDIWVGLNATGSGGSQTVTVTMQASATAGCQMDEWNGISALPVLEAFAVAGASSTAPALTLTPTDVGDVLYVFSDAPAETASPASPWSALVGPTTAGVQKNGIAYLIAPSGAAQTATWTVLAGAWTTCGVILHTATAVGYEIQNDTAAQNNAATLEAQARPDYVDSIITADAHLGSGVLSGCCVSPNTGSDLKFQVGAGTSLVNWGPVTVAAVTGQAVTAADATNPRRDLVSVNQAGTITYTAGVASATPCPPTLPRWSTALGFIDVPANATQIDATTSTSTGHVIDKRVLLGFPPSVSDYYNLITNSLAETTPRRVGLASNLTPAQGTLVCLAITLPAGMTIGHIIFSSLNAAASTPTHWWFALLDSNLNLLAVTADQLTAAWAANTQKSLAIATTAQGTQSTFTTTYTGRHYLGIMMTATTRISLAASGQTGVGDPSAFAPILFGSSTASLTAAPTFPFTGTALTALGLTAWGNVAV